MSNMSEEVFDSVVGRLAAAEGLLALINKVTAPLVDLGHLPQENLADQMMALANLVNSAVDFIVPPHSCEFCEDDHTDDLGDWIDRLGL